MKFTAKEDQYLWDNYLTIPAKRMSKNLGRSESSARQRMALIGIVVPPEIVAQFKASNQIKKGNVPVNKGKKLNDYMAPEAIERMRATQFSKGQLPHNTKADFEISVRPDNRGVKYNFIRVAVAKWIPLHRYVWESKHGKIPAKMKLIFKDGDTMNCALDNLELLTPAELMMRNTLHNYPKPIAHVIQLRGALNRQINKQLKRFKHEK